MEHIRQAVELARNRGGLAEKSPPLAPSRLDLGQGGNNYNSSRSNAGSLALDPAHLESKRIVAHNVLDHRSKPYDMLRTQVLRIMKAENWQLIGVTSPTPGCGKTLTAINLALSMARQPEESALLVDMDLQRPRVAATLGLERQSGLLSVLDGRTAMPDAIVRVGIGHHAVSVLPCETSTSHSSQWMASRAMESVIQGIRADYRAQVAVLDLPPLLTGDEVISILPLIDCVLLAVAVGVSRVSDVEQCKRHLESTEVVRVIVNKAAGKGVEHYYY